MHVQVSRGCLASLRLHMNSSQATAHGKSLARLSSIGPHLSFEFVQLDAQDGARIVRHKKQTDTSQLASELLCHVMVATVLLWDPAEYASNLCFKCSHTLARSHLLWSGEGDHARHMDIDTKQAMHAQLFLLCYAHANARSQPAMVTGDHDLLLDHIRPWHMGRFTNPGNFGHTMRR